MTGGIGPDVEKVAAVLNQLLADEFLQNIEFSLEDGRTAIYSLHRCLEEQSHQLRMMIASVAEGTRMVILLVEAPGNFWTLLHLKEHRNCFHGSDWGTDRRP